MVTEKKEIFDSDDSAGISFVVFFNIGQDRNFNKSLLDEFFWFFNYFNGQKLFSFVIKNLQYLPKWSSIEGWYNFVSVGDVWADGVLIKLRSVLRIFKGFFLCW